MPLPLATALRRVPTTTRAREPTSLLSSLLLLTAQSVPKRFHSTISDLLPSSLAAHFGGGCACAIVGHGDPANAHVRGPHCAEHSVGSRDHEEAQGVRGADDSLSERQNQGTEQGLTLSLRKRNFHVWPLCDTFGRLIS